MFLLLFTVLLIKDILDLAWHLATRMKFGTCEQNWDLHGTISGLWSQLGPSPKFGTSLQALFLLFGFFSFPRPNFSKPKPKPSKIWQKSRDRDLNRDFSTSFEMKFGKFGTYKQNWNFWDQNLGL